MTFLILLALHMPAVSASVLIPELSGAIALNQEIDHAISSFQSGGLRIPPGSRCADLLRQASLDLGRALTHQEISDNVAAVLAETQELLQPVPFAPRPAPAAYPRRHSDHCLTGNMKVRTLEGEVAIANLREGDVLLSVELSTGLVVINQIAKIKATPSQTYGRLTDLARPIEATGLHRFLTGEGRHEEDFAPIADLPAAAPLYAVDFDAEPANRLRPVARGTYACEAGVGTVYDIRMISEPHNYVVEGILVHNAKF